MIEVAIVIGSNVLPHALGGGGGTLGICGWGFARWDPGPLNLYQS